MPVDIEAILALLPELFPGVQSIPLANIRPNPDNPGPPITEEQVQELADNLVERGLLNPIRVQPDRTNPLARGPQAEGQALGVPGQGAEPQNGPGPLRGVQPHPQNPRLRADGHPWELADFNFIVLTGENRYRAAGKLQWPSIQGTILNLTALEAVETVHLDNAVRDRGWWADYQSIEQEIKAGPNLTQGQVATRLKLSRESVGWAIRLLPLLNAEARGLISRIPTNSNKENKGISETAASWLADLGPGTGLKRGVRKKGPPESGEDSQRLWPYPAIPPETQDLVRRTLAVALERGLTEAGMKALVGWVQEGHEPEQYGNTPKKQLEVRSEELGVKTTAGQEKINRGEDDQEVKPLPWSEASKHPEYRNVPVARVRVNRVIARFYARKLNYVERRVASMKAAGEAPDIRVRNLSDAEKAADPDHDFELFDGPLTLKAAQALGWPNLRALVYAIDEWEGVRLHNFRVQTSEHLTWMEQYWWIEDQLAQEPGKTASEWAVAIEEDPALVEKVLPVLKLLNEPARMEIASSVHRCYEGLTDMGGYRFHPQFALPLARLEGISKELFETQKAVEEVVRVAIENEMIEDEIEELVDWVLAGNAARDFYVKEA